MSNFIDSEAEESEHEGEEEDEEVIGQVRKSSKKEKRKKQIDSDDDEEDDDDEEVVKDLIDDNPIEEDSDNESEGSRKRKKSDDEDELDDDRLEDDDYDLLEENLGVKVQRKRFKKIRRMEDEESDVEEAQDMGDEREAIANELFVGSDNEEERPSRREEAPEQYGSDDSEGEYSDTDDFIVDDEGRPIKDKRAKRRPIFNDANLQEAQDIFGVDFDYEEFDKYDEDEYDEEEDEDEDEYENDEQQTARRSKKASRRKKKMKALYEIYEPHELERAGITEEDNRIRNTDVPERMQLRSVPVTMALDDELEEEAEWIFKLAFSHRTFAPPPKPTTSSGDIPVPPASVWEGDNWDTESVATTSKELSTRLDEKPPPPIPLEEDWEDDAEKNWEKASEIGPIAESVTPAQLAESVPVPPESNISRADWANEKNWDKESNVGDINAELPKDIDVVVPPPTQSVRTTGDWDGNNEGDWDKETTVGAASTLGRILEGDPTVPGIAKSAISAVDKNLIDLQEEMIPRVTGKIKTALDFMRNQQLEVPFIGFYRKEYVEPELELNDLWKIYKLDARFCQLRKRKNRLAELFRSMMNYQTDLILEKSDEPIPDSLRLITEDDIDRIKSIRNPEELKDMYLLFTLYYSDDNVAMKEQIAKRKRLERQKAKELAAAAAAAAGEGNENAVVDMDLDPEPEAGVRRKLGGGPYSLCKKLGVDSLVKKFGLAPDKLAENLRDNYQRNEVEQHPVDPIETARDYLNDRLKTEEEALTAAKIMLAHQISREPLVRSSVREVFFERSKVTVRPTKKGVREIDEAHPCCQMKYLTDKPVRDFRDEEFLKLVMAEDDKLLTITIGDEIPALTSSNYDTYVEEVKYLFNRDEYSKVVQEWNQLRGECVEHALQKILFPSFRKELKAKLLQDAKDYVIEIATQKLESWLQVAPYTATFEEDDEEWNTSKGIRVLALAYVPDFTQASFAAIIAPDGEPTDYFRLQNIMKNSRSLNEIDVKEKKADLETLKELILTKKPHVIIIGGESREALMLRDEITGILTDIKADEAFPHISVEILDNEMSKVYANSIKAQTEFREFPLVLREAVSLGRRLQDPLLEFSQLVNHDDEILCLRYHPLQDQVSKEELLEELITQFINKTNDVGVDINRCIASPHTSNVAQFICGLGPRKATALIKTLKQNNQRLENRTQLITVCHMGPKIFINCSGFIKIDTNSLGDSTEAYVEVLDGSRVHPETYEWARKMAVDALDYDEDDPNPASALEEILEAPEKLEELNLDAFAEELERQGFGNKSKTLYDIRKELNDRYKERRFTFISPTMDQVFTMLTKEDDDTLYDGKLITATVIGIHHKKPQGEQLDDAVPVKNEKTGMWQCAFCMKSDFPDLSEVWVHFDAGACPGQAVGVKIRLDNGISGFIPILKLSDNLVTNPEHRVKRGQTIHCRILKIDKERFSVDCTSKTSDLVDRNQIFRRPKDVYYDMEAEERDKKREEDVKKNKQRQTYVRRVIVHPSFKNISFKELIPMMEQMDQGEVIIRPSSKGSDHLTVSWKVDNGIYQHIDVREERKENMFSLGQSLYIGTEEFEDLDEIIARYVNPMASHARDIIAYKYYESALGGSRSKAEEYLREEKAKKSEKGRASSQYVLHPSKEFPGKFVLSYLPTTKVQHEFVTVTPDGFRYRQQTFQTLNQALKWFKEHYRDPPPAATPLATPKPNDARTPYATTPGIHDGRTKIPPPPPSRFSIHPAASHTTPHYTTPVQAFTPYSAFTAHTPYTPTAQTPFITPYQTPYQSSTTGTVNSQQQQPQTNSGFLHPGAVTPGGYKSTQKPATQPPRAPRQQGNGEDNDWRKAAEAWASSQQRTGWPSHSRSVVGSNQRSVPPPPHSNMSSRGQQLSQQAIKNIQNIHQAVMGNDAHHSSALNFLPERSPRSGRESLKSTPRTNFSPKSMIESSLGDETPLHDEN